MSRPEPDLLFQRHHSGHGAAMNTHAVLLGALAVIVLLIFLKVFAVI